MSQSCLKILFNVNDTKKVMQKEKKVLTKMDFQMEILVPLLVDPESFFEAHSLKHLHFVFFFDGVAQLITVFLEL